MSAPTARQLAELGLYPCQPKLERDTECTICQENVVTPVMTQCFHKFCFSCLYDWLCNSTACPICRTDLEEALKEQLEANTRTHNNAATGESSAKARAPHINRDVIRMQQLTRVDVESSARSEQAAPPTVACQRTTNLVSTRLNRLAADEGETSHGLHATLSGGSSSKTTMEERAEAALARINGGVAPRNGPEHDTVARQAGVITVDSTRMILDMLLKSNELEVTDAVPLLWSECSARVLYEWRGLLQREDGRTLLSKDLLDGMYLKFRGTIVSYGYWDKRATIPERLHNVMRQVAVAAIHGCQ